jgi:hypothetical protein
MNTSLTLESETARFSSLHWNTQHISHPIPKWGEPWHFTEGGIPDGDKGGCYALFNEKDEVIYIGVGASSGGGIYPDHGISRRLVGHVVQLIPDKEPKYAPKEKWVEVKYLRTIPFEETENYLAYGLEALLIKSVKPERNRVHK